MNFIPKLEYEHPTNGTTTITFELPPKGDPLKEIDSIVGRETRSSSGQTQYQYNYTDKSFSLDLTFLSETIKGEVEELFHQIAKFGNAFKYFPSEDEAEFYNVIWPGSKKTFKPIKVIREGTGFIYDLKIPLRVEI